MSKLAFIIDIINAIGWILIGAFRVKLYIESQDLSEIMFALAHFICASLFIFLAFNVL